MRESLRRLEIINTPSYCTTVVQYYVSTVVLYCRRVSHDALKSKCPKTTCEYFRISPVTDWTGCSKPHDVKRVEKVV